MSFISVHAAAVCAAMDVHRRRSRLSLSYRKRLGVRPGRSNKVEEDGVANNDASAVSAAAGGQHHATACTPNPRGVGAGGKRSSAAVTPVVDLTGDGVGDDSGGDGGCGLHVTPQPSAGAVAASTPASSRGVHSPSRLQHQPKRKRLPVSRSVGIPTAEPLSAPTTSGNHGRRNRLPRRRKVASARPDVGAGAAASCGSGGGRKRVARRDSAPPRSRSPITSFFSPSSRVGGPSSKASRVASPGNGRAQPVAEPAACDPVDGSDTPRAQVAEFQARLAQEDDASDASLSAGEVSDAPDTEALVRVRGQSAYMTHLCHVLRVTTAQRPDLAHLLKPSELAKVTAFFRLSPPAQALYARLFARKGASVVGGLLAWPQRSHRV